MYLFVEKDGDEGDPGSGVGEVGGVDSRLVSANWGEEMKISEARSGAGMRFLCESGRAAHSPSPSSPFERLPTPHESRVRNPLEGSRASHVTQKAEVVLHPQSVLSGFQTGESESDSVRLGMAAVSALI